MQLILRYFLLSVTMLPAIVTAEIKLPLPEITIPKITEEVQRETDSDQDFQPAMPHAKVGPIYPIYYARKKKEGWVDLTFSVEKDGSISNVLVTNDSGGAQFVTEAIKAINRWKYKPALEFKQPVQSNIHNQRLTFKFDRDKKIREKVYEFYMQGLEFIEAHDRDGMDEIYEQINDLNFRKYGEKDFADVYTLNYASHIDDSDLYLSTLKNIELVSIIVTFPDLWAELAMEKVKLLAEDHKLAEALSLLNHIEAENSKTIEQTRLLSSREQLNQYIESDIDLVIDGKTNKLGIWQHHLARNHFAITNLEGKLESLDIRCDNTRRLIDIDGNSEWQIPKKWRNCVLYFQSEKSAQFTLIEFATRKIV
ncbi:energy transducer TonB [Thalassotalea litorea]|uniref:Energy transducer TonB n=1 Tax=Thalassotalea litorea TaxID=2020715 RepID=A0A5R9IT12_9GAMM|nr:energy transducer TonB [Thalassotalea litorea]TLU66326.1 energy transducer TonB [Thalassotalea litorea]